MKEYIDAAKDILKRENCCLSIDQLSWLYRNIHCIKHANVKLAYALIAVIVKSACISNNGIEFYIYDDDRYISAMADAKHTLNKNRPIVIPIEEGGIVVCHYNGFD